MKLSGQIDELGKKIVESFHLHQTGNIIFIDEEIESMIGYVKEKYREYLYNGQHLLPFFHQTLFVLIVQIAKKWGNEDDDSYFYKKVFEKIFDDSTITLQKFPKFIDFCSNSNNRDFCWLKDNEGKTTRYKQTFLYNALAPLDSINSFIDIINNAYFDKDNMESGFFAETYEESPDSYRIFVQKYADKLIRYSEKENNVNLYGGSYKLSSALRHAFIWDNKGMSKLVAKTIDYLKAFYKSSNIDDGTYFSQLVKKYLTYKQKTINIGRKSIEYVEKVRDIKDWYAYYEIDIETKQIYIKLPLLKLKSLDQYKDLELSLSIGNERVSKQLDIVGEDYNPHINPIIIDDIADLIKQHDSIDFTIEVYEKGNNKPIYSTGNSLYRDILLFTLNSKKEFKGTILSPDKNQELIAIIQNKNYDNLKNGINNSITKISWIDNGYIIKINKGSQLNYNNRIVYFVNSNEENFAIDGKVVNNVTFEHAIGEFLIYREVDKIIFSPQWDTININDFVISISNISNDNVLTEDKKGFHREDEKQQIVITNNDFPQIEQNGLVEISILRADNKRPVLQAKYYFDNIILKIDDKPTINGVVNINILKENESIIEKFVDIQNELIRIPYHNGGLKIEIPYLKYHLYGLKDDIDIYLKKNNLVKNIYSPTKGTGDILSYNDAFIEINSKYNCNYKLLANDIEMQGNNNRYYLRDLVLNKEKNTISLILNNVKYDIYNFYCNETILSSSIDIEYNNNEFSYSINNYVGDKNSYFQIEIYDEEENHFYSGYLTELNGKFCIKNFIAGYYYYRVYRVFYNNDWERGKVLLDKNDDYEQIGDVNPIRFKNVYLSLQKITRICKVNNTFIKNIEFVKYDENGDPCYMGELHGSGNKCTKIYFIPNENTLKLYSDENEFNHLYYKDEKILIRKEEKCQEIFSVYYKELDNV